MNQQRRWSDSGHILDLESIGSTDELEIVVKREMMPRFFTLANGKIEASFTMNGKLEEKAWLGEISFIYVGMASYFSNLGMSYRFGNEVETKRRAEEWIRETSSKERMEGPRE